MTMALSKEKRIDLILEVDELTIDTLIVNLFILNC